MTVNSSANSVILILFAFSDNLSAKNSKLPAESWHRGHHLLGSMVLGHQNRGGQSSNVSKKLIKITGFFFFYYTLRGSPLKTRYWTLKVNLWGGYQLFCVWVLSTFESLFGQTRGTSFLREETIQTRNGLFVCTQYVNSIWPPPRRPLT